MQIRGGRVFEIEGIVGIKGLRSDFVQSIEGVRVVGMEGVQERMVEMGLGSL